MATHASPTKPRRTEGHQSNYQGAKPTYDIWAYAPYNFVPLPSAVVMAQGELPSHDRFAGLTGYLEISLETRSPLYVRGMMTSTDFRDYSEKRFDQLPDDAKARRVRPYEIGDCVRIPASSLRGMIRSALEIITYGKVQWVTDEPLVFRAVADSVDSPLGKTYRDLLQPDLVRAGFIVKHNGDWQIRPAQEINGKSYAVTRSLRASGASRWSDSTNAEYVHVGAGGQYLGKEAGRVWRCDEFTGATPETANGVYVFTDKKVGKKDDPKNEYIFGLPDATATCLDLSDDVVRLYEEQISQAQAKFLNNKKGALREMQPVFYQLDDKGAVRFFGHARYFRLPYANSPRDYVPDELRRDDQIDFAEAMFGFVRDVKATPQAYAGRVSFGDATLDPGQDDPFMKLAEAWLTPQILASPKPTTFQHYLMQDAGASHDPDCLNDLAHYGTPRSETQIRGHKLYWHKNRSLGEADLKFVWDRQKHKQNPASQLTGVVPVAEGKRFAFSIHFENLTREELGALIWSLQPGENQCHALGMGKPLGMGAVKLTIKRLYLSDRETRYKSLFVPPGPDLAQQPAGNPQDPATAVMFWSDELAPRPSAIVAEEAAKTRLAAELRAFAEDFERFMVMALPGEGPSFSNWTRVRTLLELLKFPGPSATLTRYLEITRTESPAGNGFDVNEYKHRPGLPDPFFVDPSTSKGHRASGPCRPPPEKQVTRNTSTVKADPIEAAPSDFAIQKAKLGALPEPNETPSTAANEFAEFLQRASAYESGMEVTATVIRAEASGFICRFGRGTANVGRLPTNPKEKSSIQVNAKIRVRLTTKNSRGQWILEYLSHENAAGT